MERPKSTAAPQSDAGSAPGEDVLHEKIHALSGKRDGDPDRERRAKFLLDRLAQRHGESDVDLLDWFVHHADVEPALRNHAVGLLLGLGHPHALRISPEALAAYRAAPSEWPALSLGVMCLYLLAELAFILYMFAARVTDVAELVTLAAVVHLPIWTLSIFGAALLPDDSSWKSACRTFTWLLWLFPILVLLAIAALFAMWSAEVGLLIGGGGALAFVPGIAAALHIAKFHPRRAARAPSHPRRSDRDSRPAR